MKVVGINAGSHTVPRFTGDTIYAWSEVLESIPLPGRGDFDALRTRAKHQSCADFPFCGEHGRYDPAIVLDLDYMVLVPRRG